MEAEAAKLIPHVRLNVSWATPWPLSYFTPRLKHAGSEPWSAVRMVELASYLR